MNEYKRAPIQSYENEMRHDIFVSWVFKILFRHSGLH